LQSREHLLAAQSASAVEVAALLADWKSKIQNKWEMAFTSSWLVSHALV